MSPSSVKRPPARSSRRRFCFVAHLSNCSKVIIAFVVFSKNMNMIWLCERTGLVDESDSFVTRALDNIGSPLAGYSL